MHKVFFIVVFVLSFATFCPRLQAQDQSENGDSTPQQMNTPLTYQCKTGKKVYRTKIDYVSEEDDDGQALEAKIELNGTTIPLGMEVLANGKVLIPRTETGIDTENLILGGEEASHWRDIYYGKRVASMDERLVYSAAKGAPLRNDFYQIPISLRLTTGSCSAMVAAHLLGKKSVVENIGAQLSLESKNRAALASQIKKCQVELNAKKFQQFISQFNICVLDECDAFAQKRMAKEKRIGLRSGGFINKNVLYNLGVYLETSSQVRKKITRVVKAEGFRWACPLPLKKTLSISAKLENSDLGNMFCVGTPTSLKGQSPCVVGVFDQGKVINPFSEANLISHNKFDYSTYMESIAAATLGHKLAPNRQVASEDPQELDPNEQAKQGEAFEEHQGRQTPNWRIELVELKKLPLEPETNDERVTQEERCITNPNGSIKDCKTVVHEK